MNKAIHILPGSPLGLKGTFMVTIIVGPHEGVLNTINLIVEITESDSLNSIQLMCQNPNGAIASITPWVKGIS